MSLHPATWLLAMTITIWSLVSRADNADLKADLQRDAIENTRMRRETVEEMRREKKCEEARDSERKVDQAKKSDPACSAKSSPAPRNSSRGADSQPERRNESDQPKR